MCCHGTFVKSRKPPFPDNCAALFLVGLAFPVYLFSEHVRVTTLYMWRPRNWLFIHVITGNRIYMHNSSRCVIHLVGIHRRIVTGVACLLGVVIVRFRQNHQHGSIAQTFSLPPRTVWPRCRPPESGEECYSTAFRFRDMV